MSIQQGKEAPLILSDGDKWNFQGPRSIENPSGFLFGQMPLLLRRYINQTLTGNNGNILKLITLFIETKENQFRATKKWVMDETGMPQDKYYKARKDLEDMGWITCENDNIYINYDFLWQQALTDPKDRINVLHLRKS